MNAEEAYKALREQLAEDADINRDFISDPCAYVSIERGGRCVLDGSFSEDFLRAVAYWLNHPEQF